MSTQTDFDKKLHDIGLTYLQGELVKQAVDKYVIGKTQPPLHEPDYGSYFKGLNDDYQDIREEQRIALWGDK